MKNSQNNQGFSIVLALGLVLLLSFTGLYLLEYMIPFSRNIKGVENASKAFYESYAGIEDALYTSSQNEMGYSTEVVSSGFGYITTGSGTNLPGGVGNSLYTPDRNRFSIEEPIQLLVGKGRLNTGTSNSIRFVVRIPDLDNSSSYNEVFKTTAKDIILWQLSSKTDSLTADDSSLINEFDINANNIKSGNRYKFWDESGIKLDGMGENFSTFYNTECNGASEECVLKISIINPLISSDDSVIPYLEYKIDTINSIPFHFSYVTSQGKSFGFSKTLNIAIPQQTTNSAFDFTVFQ